MGVTQVLLSFPGIDEQETDPPSTQPPPPIHPLPISPFFLDTFRERAGEEPHHWSLSPRGRRHRDSEMMEGWQKETWETTFLIYRATLPMLQVSFFMFLLGKMPSGIKTNIKSASMHPYQRWVWPAPSTPRCSLLSRAVKLPFAQSWPRWVQ